LIDADDIRRLGLSTFRIAMILTALRLINSTPFTPLDSLNPLLLCSDLDFNAALSITKTLIHHSALIFRQLPAETPEHAPLINSQQRLFHALPQEFDRKKYLEMAKSLNIPDKTAEKQIERYLKDNLIERIAHGSYRKR